MQSRESGDFIIVSEDNSSALCSDNAKGGFVLVHESPISKRRELRASKELNEHDRAALEKVIAAVELAAEDEDEDNDIECGAVVAPSPQRKPSFKNGRRISDIASPGKKIMSPKTKEVEPSSPTGVDASFFSSMNLPQGSEKNLLGAFSS